MVRRPVHPRRLALGFHHRQGPPVQEQPAVCVRSFSPTLLSAVPAYPSKERASGRFDPSACGMLPTGLLSPREDQIKGKSAGNGPQITRLWYHPQTSQRTLLLIQRGGGTGPTKPRQPTVRCGAKSGRRSVWKMRWRPAILPLLAQKGFSLRTETVQ